MALKLFEHPLAPYAQKVKIALYEKGLPFDRVLIDPGKPSHDGDYQAFVLASPRREVPALEDGDLRLCDSTVILEYLEERYPTPAMNPESPAERARVRMLEEMMDSVYDAVNFGIMEVKVYERATDEGADRLLSRAAHQLQRLWNRLERELEGRQWLNGPCFGRGDLVVHPQVAGSRAFGYPVRENHPRLLDWARRVVRRSSVKRVLTESAECLRVERGRQGEDAPKAIRQYRDHRLEWMFENGASDLVIEGLLRGDVRFSDSSS